MKEHIIDIKDITDSKEFIESKVPNFVVVFIYLITSLLLILLVWMWFSKVDVVVKATGVVRPDKNVSTIINVNGGALKEINYFEGKEVKKNDLLYVVDISSLILQKEVIQKSLNNLEKDVLELRVLEKSVKANKNYFSQSQSEFYNKFNFYVLKQDQLNLDYSQISKKFNNEQSLGEKFTTEATLREYKSKLESIKNAIESNKSEILYNTTSELSTKEEEVLKLKNQLKDLEKNINQNKVVSPIDGLVQVLKNYNVGDFINPNTEVLKIIPKGAKLKMEIVVNNKDISQVDLGTKAKFRLLAFPYKEYGIIEGNVKNISEDILIDPQNNNMTYKVEAEIPNDTLYNRDGKKGKIKVGMVSEVRIVSKRKKILRIILEKLDFMKEM